MVDSKGGLVLPKAVRAEARIEVNHELVVKVAGVGRVELLDPSVLMARAQEIGTRKLAGWKELDHEATGYLHKSVKRR